MIGSCIRLLAAFLIIAYAAVLPADAYRKATFSGVVVSSDATRLVVKGRLTDDRTTSAPVTFTFLVGPDYTGITTSDGSPTTKKLADLKPGQQVTVSFYLVTLQTAMKLISVQLYNGFNLNVPLTVGTLPPSP